MVVSNEYAPEPSDLSPGAFSLIRMTVYGDLPFGSIIREAEIPLVIAMVPKGGLESPRVFLVPSQEFDLLFGVLHMGM